MFVMSFCAQSDMSFPSPKADKCFPQQLSKSIFSRFFSALLATWRAARAVSENSRLSKLSDKRCKKIPAPTVSSSQYPPSRPEQAIKRDWLGFLCSMDVTRRAIAVIFTKAAVKISPQLFTAESVLVPLLVESIKVFPLILQREYSRGEFPPSNPSMGLPSCSPPRSIFSEPCRSRSFSANSNAFSGDAQGYMAGHPFSKITAMFEVALNMSITTHTIFCVFSPRA